MQCLAESHMLVDSANAVVSSWEMQNVASLNSPKILINIAVFIGDPWQTESGLDTYQNAIKNSLCHCQTGFRLILHLNPKIKTERLREESWEECLFVQFQFNMKCSHWET